MEVQKLRQTFHEIDADHTGTISFVEMAQACKRMNLDVDLESMMRTMDEDGDGVINYDEFITATADRQLVHHQNNIWWAFCEYDTNGVRTLCGFLLQACFVLTMMCLLPRMGLSPRKSCELRSERVTESRQPSIWLSLTETTMARLTTKNSCEWSCRRI